MALVQVYPSKEEDEGDEGDEGEEEEQKEKVYSTFNFPSKNWQIAIVVLIIGIFTGIFFQYSFLLVEKIFGAENNPATPYNDEHWDDE